MIILIFSALSFVSRAHNQQKYLDMLNAKMRSIEVQVQGLEVMDRKLRMMDEHAGRKGSLTDIFYEIHQLAPPGITLDSFSYEAGKSVQLSGQASELNHVLTFASLLEKSPVFSGYEVKIKQTAQKPTLSGNFLFFEIGCAKKG